MGMAKKKVIKLNAHAHKTLLILILILAAYVIYISKNFIMPIISAAILSFVTYPLFLYLKKRTKKTKLSAVLLLTALTLLFLIPLVIIIFLIANEAISFFSTYNSENLISSLETGKEYIKNISGVSLDQLNAEEFLANGLSRIKNMLLNSSLFILNSITSTIFSILFIIIFMYYFYLYGPKIYRYIYVSLPFSDKSKRILNSEMKNDIRALLLGQGLVAIIQGAICGIGFFIFGVPNIFLWTFVTMIAAFIPVIGTWVTWLPASIYLFMTGNALMGIGLGLWGLIIVSNIDSILRPFLVNSMSKIDFLVVLVGVFVGIKAFGLLGLVLGPLLISMLLTLMKIYIEESVERT